MDTLSRMSNGSTASSPATLQALTAADQCVKCGLCLPHCPTYGLHRNEADGPRGRIALAQGLLSGQLAASASLEAHLAGCLACRACEAVCPAQVRYATVLDTARSTLPATTGRWLLRGLGVALGNGGVRTLLRLAARIGHALRRRRWLPAGWGWIAATPRLRAPQAPAGDAIAPSSGRMLFIGCVGDVLERQAAQDALDLFAALGQPLALPRHTSCCGALYQHGGLPGPAADCTAHNEALYGAAETILPLASGCGTALRDLSPTLRGKVRDLCDVLEAALNARPLPLATLALKVGVHIPCTQANVFGGAAAVMRLLGCIPGLTLVPLAPASGCCGAAGVQMFTQPGQADALRAPKLTAAATVDVIVSANIGCSMHLAAGMADAGRPVEILHPVSLVARTWRHAARPEG
jgi:glycolate oxidase iron-sulfur subunit